MAEAHPESTGRRLAWFVGIWAMSVAALAAVAFLIRWWLRA